MMVLLQLPLISSDDTVDDAFGIIAEKHAPAIVVKHRNNWLLLPSRTIFRAYRDNHVSLEALMLAGRSRVLQLYKLESGELPTIPNSSFENTWLEKEMKSSGAKFAMFASSQNERKGMVNVISRRSVLKRVLPGSNMICVCTGINKHLREVNDNTDLTGKACTVCGSPYICTVSL